MALYIEAPDRYVPAPGHGPSVFLAGGISACPDWQSEVVADLTEEHVTLLNPRRASFDLSDTSAAEEQIAWEVTHRRHPALAAMLFWFPACDPAITVQPITLLELGEALARPGLALCVGADPGYPRRDDVVLQCRYTRPDVTVSSNLTDTVAALRELLELPG
ncbi:nucleoside 2-deoxyribosyltransferase domain-containing protein [Pseudonocardia spinosispora]|uniref:nucleoside 2-deoxyribosyltransferase domain-containing protein n=1 Tax=Pseudonocardia spinosispora TaxID=103441 RepID=UPI0004263B12|nr:nucleoside 2-deoxyribosyltransferase domain-containing protein [Pseudonocardia spinosispora]